jgi:hypothetical protein
MFNKLGVYMFWVRWYCSGMLLLLAGARLATADQWAKQVQQQAAYPSKIAIELPKISPTAGGSVELVLHVLNDRGEQTPASNDVQVQVDMLTTAGKVVQSKTCVIPAKATAGKCVLGAPSSGIFKVRAVPKIRELLDATEILMVRPAPKTVKKGQFAPPPENPFGFRIVRAAFNAPEPEFEPPSPQTGSGSGSSDCDGPASRGPARVEVDINAGGEADGAFRAGKDSATISAFFLADDGGTSPSTITVWLSQDRGDIEDKPILIKPCHSKGVAHLTSGAAAQVSVKFHVFPEKYNQPNADAVHATFITPIAGIGILPSARQILSLIDRAPVVAQFYDYDGKPISTDIPRTVTFVSDNAVIGPKDQSVEVKAGADSAANMLLPSWVGVGSIYVTSEHLKNADPHVVQVTFLAVLIVCLAGSLIGGLTSYYKDGGKILSRLLFGIAGGIVFAWMHVFWVSPKLDWEIVHNAATLFVLALLGGYLGVKALDAVLDKLGFGH